MDVKVRAAGPEDTNACGRICYDAFAAIAAAHGYPCDFPSPDVARSLVMGLLAHPGIFGVVAEVDGVVVGSNFLDERTTIAGVGPITVDPAVQNGAVGRQLMMAVMDRAAEQKAAGVRLVQTAYHTRSLALYAKLGFEVREPLACLQGRPLGIRIEGFTVRPANAGDFDACNELCRRVHGHDRAPQLSDALLQDRALVVEHEGRITGYSSGLAFFSHSVGETVDDIKALIGAATEFGGSGILVPMRQGALFRFCLENGLRVVQVMTLMTTGQYQEPQGAYLPSIMY
ncbi:MAG TPA: GNAT family N-acetyltransferase [Acidimicrobiia bacterium]|jgi:predicted N-acetyltransferase YhbS|nr:GNAT family N-acetyltransferase [Acidimicrobiia bacterium]